MYFMDYLNFDDDPDVSKGKHLPGMEGDGSFDLANITTPAGEDGFNDRFSSYVIRAHSDAVSALDTIGV